MTVTKDLKSENKIDDEYLTITQTSQRFPAFTEGSLR